MTVSEAFDTFKSELELPERKQEEASRTQKEVRARLSATLPVENSFLTGSYARHTKINPLSDVDVFLVRNKDRTGLSTDGSGILSGAALDQVRDAVQTAYPRGATIKKQNRSVNLQIAGLSFGFDLTPAWLRHPDGYWIPDADSGNWIATDPDAHAARMTQANVLNGGKLKPLIKMVKHWSRNNFDRFCSFHLELICANIFRTEKLDNYQLGVTAALVHLSEYVGRPMLDPIYGSSRVDQQLTQDEQSELKDRIHYDAGNAIGALTLERNGNDGQAIERWKHIFLRGFPK